MHRFLILGPDLRIDAGFSLFIPSCVHRFLISGPDLRIDAGFSLFKPSCVHRFLISGLNLGITVWFRQLRPSRQRPSASDSNFSWWQRRMARQLRPSRQQPSASDSNFRSGKEEWPACYDRRDNGLPRPILIFVAAKKNGPPATAVATTAFRVRI